MRTPEFAQLLKVLRREAPSRPVLFEFSINLRVLRRAAGNDGPTDVEGPTWWPWATGAYAALGYDHCPVPGSQFHFPRPQLHHESSISLNETPAFTDRQGFDAYPWPDPAAVPSLLDACASALPPGMKLIVIGPFGVLENVIRLVGYDNLCLLLVDDPQFVHDIFEAVGSRLAVYYRMHASHPGVGACVSNDDWGFKTQPMLAPADMRRYVFPWHQEIVEAIHAAGRPAILHSCGQLDAVMDDIIDDLKYDAKHSFEDTILPVEQAWQRWGHRIAILGGVDVDFLCRSKPEQITNRARRLLELTQCKGYALGSGNSIPKYVPDEGYDAMIRAVR